MAGVFPGPLSCDIMICGDDHDLCGPFHHIPASSFFSFFNWDWLRSTVKAPLGRHVRAKDPRRGPAAVTENSGCHTWCSEMCPWGQVSFLCENVDRPVIAAFAVTWS